MHQNNKKIARDTHYKQWISVNLLKNNILRKNGTHDCRKQETSLEQVKPDRFYLLSLRRYTDFIRDRISE